MTITVYPADAVAGAPSYTGRKLRQVTSALASGATAARPLGGFSGVRPGSGVVGLATSTTWTITPHAGQLDLEAAAEAGVYLYSIDANQTGSVTAADANNPRVDIVYLTLNDPAEGDGSSAPGIVPGYLAGTAAATPVAPATPARSVVLFTIAVPKAGGGSPTVTMTALEVGAAGSPVGVRSQAQRDALTKFVGLQCKRLDAGGRIETCDGTTWDFVDWTNMAIDPGGWTIPAGQVRWQVCRRGMDIRFRGALLNATFTGTDTLVLALPAGIPPPPAATAALTISSNTANNRAAWVQQDGTVQVYAEGASNAWFIVGGGYRLD